MRVCAMPLVFSIYNEKISGAGAVSSSMCSIPGAQISESNTADTAVEEGGDQINTLLQVEDLVHSARGNYVENLAERMYLLELCLYQVL